MDNMEDKYNNKLLLSIQNSLQKNVINDTSLIKTKIESKSTLRFTLIENVEIKNIEAIQSVFIGVVFRNCTIIECNFSRSDFEGTSFENCYIKNTNFNDTDIRTVNFSKSKILSCSFKDSTFLDNYFIKCVLSNCVLKGSNVSRCSFENSILNKAIENQISTWLHTKFTKCSIRHTNFYDCTFSYGIFKDCKLQNVRLNADALGLTFGLTLKNLEYMSYAFLGEEFEKNIDIKLKNFIESYHNQGWGIQFYILSINFVESMNLRLLIGLFNFIDNQIQHMVGPTKDDLEFINNVMIELNNKFLLPFYAVIEIRNSFIDRQKNLMQTELTNIVRQNLLILSTTMSDQLLNHIYPLLNYKNKSYVKIEMTFTEKPLIQIMELFSILSKDTNCILDENKLLKTYNGSWIEVLHTSIANIIVLTVFVYSINGFLVGINKLKKTTKALLSSSSDINKNTPENISSHIVEINKFISKANKKEMKKIYKSLKKLVKIDLIDDK